MKSDLNNKKHIKSSFSLLAISLGLNFSLPVTTAMADLPTTKQQTTVKQQQTTVRQWQPAKPKKIWAIPHAAGKPAPYTPVSISPISGQGSTIITPKTSSKTQVKPSGSRPVARADSSSTAASGEQIVLQSRDIASYGPAWQSFSDYLTVPKGSEKVPLFLTFTNGSGSGPRFQDVRVKLAGKSLATIKDFTQNRLTRNLTGAVGVGDSLLLVQAYGPSGAHLSWQFTTPKVEITTVTPKDIALNGTITVTGRNFSDQASVNQVFFDKTAATVISANRTQLKVKVPANSISGKVDLVVAVGPSRSKPYKLTLKGAPKIDSVDMLSVTPGLEVTITGEGFSTNNTENQVSVGGVSAQIVSSTARSITFIVPDQLDSSNPAWDVPIKVKTNGVESVDPENRGTIRIQSRVY